MIGVNWIPVYCVIQDPGFIIKMTRNGKIFQFHVFVHITDVVDYFLVFHTTKSHL